MLGLAAVSSKSSTWMLNTKEMSRPPCLAKARRVLNKLDIEAEYEGNVKATGEDADYEGNIKATREDYSVKLAHIMGRS